MMKKVVVTGGHLSPALATIEVLGSHGWEVTYVGRKHALEGDAAIAYEYKVITENAIPYRVITSGRLQRRLSWRSIVSLLKIPIGFGQACKYLTQIRPQVI